MTKRLVKSMYYVPLPIEPLTKIHDLADILAKSTNNEKMVHEIFRHIKELYTMRGEAVPVEDSSMVVQQVKTSYFNMMQANGQLIQLKNENSEQKIDILIPLTTKFAKYDEVLFSTAVIESGAYTRTESPTQNHMKLLLDNQVKSAVFESDVVSVEARSYQAGDGKEQGGWINRIPIADLDEPVQISIPYNGNNAGNVMCAYEDPVTGMWEPIKKCQGVSSLGYINCCSTHLSTFALLTDGGDYSNALYDSIRHVAREGKDDEGAMPAVTVLVLLISIMLIIYSSTVECCLLKNLKQQDPAQA